MGGQSAAKLCRPHAEFIYVNIYLYTDKQLALSQKRQ